MEYSVKRIDVEEKELLEITRFLTESFPKTDKFSLEFVRWQYAQNPLGKMVGFNAWNEGKIVSHFAGLPIAMNLFGEDKKGLLCINVSTNVNYRGQKLFTILGEKVIEYAAQNGFDFMIAVPNANSTHAFLKYFGFSLVAPLSVKVGIGKNIYANKRNNCYKSWDREQWQWRLKNPTNTYSCDERGIISTPISYFIKSLSESSLSDNVKDIAQHGIGFRPFNLYIGLGANTSKGLYFNIPAFIKRPPFNLVFKDLKGDTVIKGDDIFLQLIDLDTI